MVRFLLQKSADRARQPSPPEIPRKGGDPPRGDQRRVHGRVVVTDAETGAQPHDQRRDPICACCRAQLHRGEGDQPDGSGVETREKAHDLTGELVGDPGDSKAERCHTGRPREGPEHEGEETGEETLGDYRDRQCDLGRRWTWQRAREREQVEVGPFVDPFQLFDEPGFEEDEMDGCVVSASDVGGGLAIDPGQGWG